MVDNSKIFFYLLEHGLDLDVSEQFFIPFFSENSKILNAFPQIIPKLELLLEGVEVIVVSFSVDIKNVLVAQHLVDLPL